MKSLNQGSAKGSFDPFVGEARCGGWVLDFYHSKQMIRCRRALPRAAGYQVVFERYDQETDRLSTTDESGSAPRARTARHVDPVFRVKLLEMARELWWKDEKTEDETNGQ